MWSTVARKKPFRALNLRGVAPFTGGQLYSGYIHSCNILLLHTAMALPQPCTIIMMLYSYLALTSNQFAESMEAISVLGGKYGSPQAVHVWLGTRTLPLWSCY